MKPMICLNPACRANKKKHFVSNCAITDEPTRARLFEEYRKPKRAPLNSEKKGSERTEPFGRVAQILSWPHSSVFRASFADGLVAANVLADQGAEGDLISTQLL